MPPVLFDEVVVAVGTNVSKNRLFTPDERIAMLRRACADLPNVTVEGFAGLVTTFCTEHDIAAIVKGLRAASDFDYELQMAQMNSSLTGVETVFIPTSPERGFVSSTLVKEVAGFGGDVSAFVPDFVHDELEGSFARLTWHPVPRPRFCGAEQARYDTRRSVVTSSGRDSLSKLDPRAPLVLDTRELGRRPGSQREVTRTVPAPADLGIEVLGVPEGSQVELDLRLEAVMEGVLVSGQARAGLEGECVRCLEPIRDEVEVSLQELFVLRGPGRRSG